MSSLSPILTTVRDSRRAVRLGEHCAISSKKNAAVIRHMGRHRVGIGAPPFRADYPLDAIQGVALPSGDIFGGDGHVYFSPSNGFAI